MGRGLTLHWVGLLRKHFGARISSTDGTGWQPAWCWLALGFLVLALAGCQPDNGGSASPTPTMTIPPNYAGSLRIMFSASTTYEQAVAIVQGAGMQLEGPSCIGQGAHPGPGLPSPTPTDEHQLYGQSHTLMAGLHVTQAMADKIAASPQVTALELIHIPLCV